MYRSEDQSPKFWGQKWKNRDRSSGERLRESCQRWKGSKESAINGKQKNNGQKETPVVSATMGTNVEYRRAHPLLPQNRSRKTMGKLLRLSEAGVRLVRDIEDRAKMTSQGNARTPPVIHGILPCVRITEPNRAANPIKSALLCTERLDRQPNKRPKKNCGKGSVASLRRIPGLGAAEIQVDFADGHRILGTKAQRFFVKGCITTHENSGKKVSIARCDSAHWFSWA